MTVKISGNSSSSTPSFAGDDGDSGLHATADQVQLVTNGTVGVTVDSSQNVGINTASPSTRLSVVAGSANGIELGQDSDQSTNSSRLFFSTSAGSNAIHSSSGILRFFSGSTAGSSSGSERMRILPAGGIAFNGDTAAANALDDYEEGSVTLSITNSVSSPTFSTTPNTTGYYVKVGNLCTVYYYSSNFSVSSNGSGSARITGLPFTSANLASGYATGSITHSSCFQQDVENGYVPPNLNFFVPIVEDGTSSTSYTTSTTVFLMFTVTYRTS